MGKTEKRTSHSTSASFRVGAVALIFLIIGYQVALFVYKASVARTVEKRAVPDTVYVVDRRLAEEILLHDRPGAAELPPCGEYAPSGKSRRADSVSYPRTADGHVAVRRNSATLPRVEEIVRANAPRRYESFAFDPNTVSVEDLMRLGFTQKQAESIDNYRRKGGRFRRKEDFARSFVVSDSVFERLAPFIDIPLTDLNAADSAAFDALPGIGPWFAAKMVSYREELHGYSYPEQLMDIWHFDEEKYDSLKDLITVGESEPYPLWSLTEEELRRHPYLRHAAHAIALYRRSMPREAWTVERMHAEGALDDETFARLRRCRIADP